MALQRRFENNAEKTISQLGEDYIRGAIEYNTKEMQRDSCSATMKDQKNRIVNYFSDLVKSLFSAKVLPSQKVRFYKSVKVDEEEVNNNV